MPVQLLQSTCGLRFLTRDHNCIPSTARSMDGLNAKLSAKEEISVLNSSIVIDRDMILSEKRCDHVPMAFGERREIAFSPWLAKLLKMDESPILKRSMTDSTGKRALLHFDAASQYSTDESLEKSRTPPSHHSPGFTTVLSSIYLPQWNLSSFTKKTRVQPCEEDRLEFFTPERVTCRNQQSAQAALSHAAQLTALASLTLRSLRQLNMNFSESQSAGYNFGEFLAADLPGHLLMHILAATEGAVGEGGGGAAAFWHQNLQSSCSLLSVSDLTQQHPDSQGPRNEKTKLQDTGSSPQSGVVFICVSARQSAPSGDKSAAAGDFAPVTFPIPDALPLVFATLVLLNLCTFHEERVSGHAEASIKRFTRKIHSVLLHAWIPDTGVPHLVFRILVDRTLLFLVSQAYNRNLL
ncbi:hypothetical protein MJT46_000007 [Ovis ammon polii x Ovis aries]|nr:hypothetical protein MJT46_000007 [Ovis ammon polii x Ovis aries]